jgi:hypothetical protein
MKNSWQLFGGLILLLALTVSAFAGQINCPGVVDPPPPTEATTTTAGQIDCPGLTQLAMSLIQGIVVLP